MRKLFKKGERVRNKVDGKVMEVLRYIKNNIVEVKWFDLEDPDGNRVFLAQAHKPRAPF